MKRLVEVTDDGFDRFLGKVVLVMCGNYFYHGKMVALNESHLILKDVGIVYETGQWGGLFSDRQDIATEWSVMLHAIESIGEYDV